MPEIHVTLSHSLPLLIIAVLIAGVASYVVYRVTVPPLPRSMRLLLSLLRFLSLVLLLFLIGEPILSLMTRTHDEPVAMVLIDNSRSMAIRDAQGDRRDITFRTADALRGLELPAGEMRFALFDTRLRLLEDVHRDSLSFSGAGTDIAKALQEVKGKLDLANIQAVVLVTDGNPTTGTNPLYEAMELGVPVFTIGIGDTSEQKDVLIRKAVTNVVTYVGNRVPVQATVRSIGYNGERVEVTLSDEKQVVEQQLLTLEPGTRDYSMTFHYVPQAEGIQRLTVAVSRVPGELTPQNNRFQIVTRVLKSKMKILMIAGSPSPDVAFIRRALEQDANIQLTTRIERKDGQFYEGPLTPQLLNESECLVLIGFPTATSSLQTVTAILQGATGGKGVFILLSRTVDLARLRMLDQILPVTPPARPSGSADEYQVFLSVNEMKLAHPILKLSGQNPAEVWSRMPPVFALQTSFIPRPEADVLGFVRVQSTTLHEPLLVARSVAGRKTIVFLGYGLWRWKMLSEEGTQTVLDQFLGASVRWLTTRDDERPVRVKTTKEHFTTQESVDFTAQVYDENYQPVGNADVVVTVEHGQHTETVHLDALGNGQYEGSLERPEEGEYRYTAKVSVGGTLIGEDRGSFTVGEIPAEFLETRMNKVLLEQIAARTGGRFYEPHEIPALARDVAALPHFQPRLRTSGDELQLWNSPRALAALVMLFSLEWFLRKRHGML